MYNSRQAPAQNIASQKRSIRMKIILTLDNNLLKSWAERLAAKRYGQV
jgi:hypothetical protein